MTVTLGIDAGSVAVKALALSDGRPIGWLEEPTRPDISAQCRGLLGRTLRHCDLAEGDVTALCATGYGRNLVA
ncbi:unnamed protein product, partial [marine sediment metagenome]